MKEEEIIKSLQSLSKGDKGKLAVRALLNGIGSFVPLVSAAASTWSEMEQQQFNDLLLELSKLLCNRTNELSAIVDKFNLDDSPEALMYTLKSMFDEPTYLRIVHGEEVPIMISQATLQKLLPFKDTLIALRSTGATSTMGTGCRAGNHIEEKLFPYGVGSGFVIRYLGESQQ